MWSDIETSKDLLGFSVHASLLKEVVTNDKNLPITIGLYGDWGSGKSSVLQILRESLDEDKDTIVIYFDGWSFESFDDAKMALIHGIIDELEKNETFVKKIKDGASSAFEKLKKSVNWMRNNHTYNILDSYRRYYVSSFYCRWLYVYIAR